MKKQMVVVSGLSVVLLLAGCGGETNDPGPGGQGVSKAAVGAMLYKDTNLSNPPGQSCETCHSLDLLAAGSGVSARGFADPNSTFDAPVSPGAVTGVFGDRNAPTAAYAMFAPDFQYDTTTDPANPRYIGGQFLDGRAVDLVEQAKGPFLNPKEMNMANEAAVVAKVRDAAYANMFKQVFGASSLDSGNEATAYNQIAEAIAAFESTAMFAPFSSKFDAVQAGRASFTAAEQNGFDLFQIDGKGKCAECHKLEKIGGSSGVLFTDFSYWNIGVPQNPNNPAGTTTTGFTDIGLAANPNLVASAPAAGERGKFKVPTLRNVELTAPYMHNGVFETLNEVMNFYNVRENPCYDTSITDTGKNGFVSCWPATLVPEVGDNLELTFTGDLLLTAQEVDDLVAFMKTLTDGYFVP